MYRLIDKAAEHLPPELAVYWWALGMDGPRYVLYLEMIAAAILWAWAMYRGYRWARGHKNALGRWWSRDDYAKLIQHLHDEERAGRLLAFEEVNALNEYRHGKDFRRIIDKQYGHF